MMTVKNKWVLVTGASGGLGSDFVTLLAQQGANVVLAARKAEPMEKLAEELRSRYQVQAIVEGIDLGKAGAGLELKNRLDARGIVIDLLISNAGFGIFGEFIEQPLEKQLEMLRLNVLGTTEICHIFAKAMATRQSGRILLVASLTAFQPSPAYAAYAASKSYILSFGEALRQELAPHKVFVTVLSPGLMKTEFLAAAGQTANPTMSKIMMNSIDVAKIGIRAFLNGKAGVIAGTMNKVFAFSTRLMPRTLQSRLAYAMVKK